MKLKKIVSLAMSGVLAVSMLTACGDNISEQPPVDNGNDTTPATGYSATFEGRLGDKADANISMSDSADLNAALKAAMEFASHANIADKYDNDMHGKATFVNPNGTTPLAQVARVYLRSRLICAKWRK